MSKIAEEKLNALDRALHDVGQWEQRMTKFGGTVTVIIHAESSLLLEVEGGVVLRQVLTLLRPELEKKLAEARDRMSECHQDYLDASVGLPMHATEVRDAE